MRPTVTFDIESTGTDVVKDRLVKLSAIKQTASGHQSRFRLLCNPGIPIPPVVQTVIQLTDADVAEWEPFDRWAPALLEYMSGCDLAGFGIQQFDIPFLWEHFARCGLRWDLRGMNILDAAVVMKRKEERTLGAAVRMYLGREHRNPHDDMADAEETIAVIEAQRKHYPDLGNLDAYVEMSKYTRDDGSVKADLSGKLYRDINGVLRWSWGKYKDQPVVDEVGYAEWFCRQDFNPENTKLVIRAEIKKALSCQL